MSVAYSDKTIGVFESAGAGGCDIDPRTARRGEIVERVIHGFRDRRDVSAMLRDSQARTAQTLRLQFQAMCSAMNTSEN